MNARRFFLLGLPVWALLVPDARAHFLFIHITPPAKGGRAAEVFFSDQAEAGDPRFVANIAGTRLWAQTAPGKFQPLKVLKAADRLRAHLPVAGSVGVVGACEYGVISRPGQPAFLLRYYPRAVSGNPEELNKLKSSDQVPLEVLATFAGDHVDLTALREGKPVPNAEFHTVAADLKNEHVVAGADGKATWKPPAPGRYAVYVRHVIKEPGKAEGQDYEEVREFATLGFDWPVRRKDADPEAVALFEEALASRATWKDFPGFTAHIAGSVDGRRFDGEVAIDAEGNVRLETKEKAARKWVKDQLESITLHRIADSSEAAKDRPKPVLRFAEARDDNPLGRLLIFEGGKFASSYRVKDRQITVVNRDLGARYMTITVLDNERNAEGQFLPRSYAVQYWDPATGALERSETVRDSWRRVGTFDLPVEHTVTLASEGGLTARAFTLSDHRLLAKAAAKAAP